MYFDAMSDLSADAWVEITGSELVEIIHSRIIENYTLEKLIYLRN